MLGSIAETAKRPYDCSLVSHIGRAGEFGSQKRESNTSEDLRARQDFRVDVFKPYWQRLIQAAGQKQTAEVKTIWGILVLIQVRGKSGLKESDNGRIFHT